MKYCWLSLSAFAMSPPPVSILVPTAHLFFLLYFSASVLWLARSQHLISFLRLTCSSFFSFALAHALLNHTLILSNVKLITLPHSLPLWCESDYGGWHIRWFVVVCTHVCMWEWRWWHDGRQVKRLGTEHRHRQRLTVCHLLSAVVPDVLPQCNLRLNMEYNIYSQG